MSSLLILPRAPRLLFNNPHLGKSLLVLLLTLIVIPSCLIKSPEGDHLSDQEIVSINHSHPERRKNSFNCHDTPFILIQFDYPSSHSLVGLFSTDNQLNPLLGSSLSLRDQFPYHDILHERDAHIHE